MNPETLVKIARLIRHDILVATSRAGSGHPTSSLSAVALMVGLMFGGTFRYYIDRPEHPNNDRLVFSKGHASPLIYALWAAAGALRREELFTYRSFGSPLEGHPTPRFPYVDAATGSLGQGLSVGVGLALNARFLDRLPYRTFVLLGDSEMAEGSQWEALQIAAHYELDNLVGILSLPDIAGAYRKAVETLARPTMIIARTLKGKGVSFIEDRNGWHGKTLGEEELDRALEELGPVDESVRGTLPLPEDLTPAALKGGNPEEPSYPEDTPVATRTAYGNALSRLYPRYPDIVVLDGEVSNSTKSAVFKERHPERFFTRAFDQIRMSRHSSARIVFVGSHAGVSIGPDGPSQMGLEDLALFRTLPGAAVLYPSDAMATERLVEEAALLEGITYLRTTRGKTPVIYGPEAAFPVGGSKVLRRSGNDIATVAAAVPEARLHILAVRKTPRSGRPEELLDDQDISRRTIVDAVKALTV